MNILSIVIYSLLILLFLIIIICSLKFQKRQKKVYKDIQKIVSEKKDVTFIPQDSVTNEEIQKIDSTLNINLLMQELYDTYILFEEKINNFDYELDDVLIPQLKIFYINKMDNCKKKGYKDEKNSINLLGYKITEFNGSKLTFRVNITCIEYRMFKDKIISGSNYEKVEQVIALTYVKENEKWLISNYDKMYEKKIQ